MINSLGAIGSYQSLFSTQTSQTTSQSVTSFDDALQSSATSENSETSAAGGSGGSGATGSKSEMDLNNDGTVTVDEIIKYMEMQQAGTEFEQNAAEEGSQQMSQENNNVANINDFKNQQASKAYSISQNLISDVTDMISQSFFG